MSFDGYKYRFGLYAAHSNINISEENIHFHNFTITLYINAAGCKPDENYNVEKTINNWLKPFQGNKLSQTDLFKGKVTTVEGMGNTFFEPLYDLIKDLGYELVRLEIYENPIRVYAASKKRLDSSVNEINSIPLECLPVIEIEDNENIDNQSFVDMEAIGQMNIDNKSTADFEDKEKPNMANPEIISPDNKRMNAENKEPAADNKALLEIDNKAAAKDDDKEPVKADSSLLINFNNDIFVYSDKKELVNIKNKIYVDPNKKVSVNHEVSKASDNGILVNVNNKVFRNADNKISVNVNYEVSLDKNYILPANSSNTIIEDSYTMPLGYNKEQQLNSNKEFFLDNNNDYVSEHKEALTNRGKEIISDRIKDVTLDISKEVFAGSGIVISDNDNKEALVSSGNEISADCSKETLASNGNEISADCNKEVLAGSGITISADDNKEALADNKNEISTGDNKEISADRCESTTAYGQSGLYGENDELPKIVLPPFEKEFEQELSDKKEPEREYTQAVQKSSQSNTKENRPKHKHGILLTILKIIVGLVCFGAAAIATMYIVKKSGRYPQGSDTFCHLYRADLILKNIKNGNWFPLYDPAWYNGVEIMRYWGPLPLYIIAGLEGIFGCSVIDAYVLFLGAIIILGGCGWLLWGIAYKRTPLAVLIGMIWFYMPENMRVVIYEGNLPRGVINALLPFYFYFLWRVMADKKKNSVWPLMFVTMLITLCHLGITLMLLATVLIFVLIYSVMNHSPKSSFAAIGASIAGVLLAGIWVVPALIGGAASGSSTNQVMKFFFESAFVSLNPFTRINGDALSFYFGASVFLICMLGIIFGTKKVKPGFITAVLLYLFTTKSVYAFFSKLPFSQFLWMIRFIPIALAVAMVSLLMWKQLKKWMVLLLCLLLLADCATSYQYIYFPKDEWIENVQESLDTRAQSLLLTKAKEITNQRMAVLDLSRYGSFAPYYISGVGKCVNYTFGAGWEGAGTASNIVNLNTAAQNGWYVYLFDRALELGNDTVLIPIQNLKEKSKDVDNTIESAKISGYNLTMNNGESLLFHKDTEKQFGVVTEYKNIAIGTSASGIAMIFPDFEEGMDNNLNDYTFEELSKYHNIYLSGITYDDKESAEELLLKLSESGIHIFIDMNNVPYDKVKKHMELFGVYAQDVTLTEAYPELEFNGEIYQSLDFSADIDQWNSVYLNGLEKTQGYFKLAGNSFPFYGTVKNENLHFMGLNLVYYLETTRDTQIMKLASSIFGMSGSDVANRSVVPVSIETENNEIKINTAYDNVNTALSDIDIFSSSKSYRVQNNLIVVNSGTTVIDINYPHFMKGSIVTAIGLGLAILTYVCMRRMKVNEESDETKDHEDKQKINGIM